jgi:DNA-binding transcriptional LysR family regulator
MNITLKELEAFAWIVRLGGFEPAASHLQTTQATISARIRELEDKLGYPVFDRRRRKAALAPRGRALVRYAERMLALSQEISQRFVDTDVTGVVRLGATGTIAVSWLPKLLKRIEAERVGIEIEFYADLSANLVQLLAEGRLDLAFLAGQAPSGDFRSEVLGRVPLIWLAHESLELPRRVLSPAELVAWPILTDVPGTYFHRLVTGWFEAGGVEPARHHGSSSLATRLRLIEEGLAVGIMPLTAIPPDPARHGLRVVDVEPQLPDLEHVLAYPSRGDDRVVEVIIRLAKTILLEDPNFRFSAMI